MTDYAGGFASAMIAARARPPVPRWLAVPASLVAVLVAVAVFVPVAVARVIRGLEGER